MRWLDHLWFNPDSLPEPWLSRPWRRRSLLRAGLGFGLGVSGAIALESWAGGPGVAPVATAVSPPEPTPEPITTPTTGPDSFNLAIALNQGQQHYIAGRYGAAIALWEPLIHSSHVSSAQRTVVQIYLARAWQALGQRHQAHQWQAQAKQQLQRLPPGPEQQAIAARWFGFQGQLAFDQGDLTQALSAFTTARDRYQDLDDSPGFMGSTLNMALVFQALGAERRSLTLLRDVETQLTPALPLPLQYRARYALAHILQHLGYLSDAETRLTALLSAVTESSDQADASQLAAANLAITPDQAVTSGHATSSERATSSARVASSDQTLGASAVPGGDAALRSRIMLNLAHIAAERAHLAQQSSLPWNRRLVSTPLALAQCPQPLPHTRYLLRDQGAIIPQKIKEALDQCDRWLAQVKTPAADLLALAIAAEFDRDTATALATAWADRPLPSATAAAGRWAIAQELAGVRAVLAPNPPLLPVPTVMARLQSLYDLVANPDHALPQPQHTDLRHTDPRNIDPRNIDPRNIDPRNIDPWGPDPWSVANLLGWMGRCAQHQRQWDRAAELTQQAIAILEPLNVAEWSFPWLWQWGQIVQAQTARSAQGGSPSGPGDPAGVTGDRLRTIYSAAGAAADRIRDHFIGVDRISPDAQPSLDIDRHREFLDQIEPFYHDWIRVLLAHRRDWPQARQVAQALRVKEVANFLQCRLDNPDPQDLSAIAAMSQDRTAVLAVLLSPQQIDVLLELPDTPDLHRATTPIDALTLQCTLLKLIQSLKDVSAAIATRQAAQAFYDWIVAPVRSRLDAAGVETLVFALDGALRNLPPAVLHDGDRYLIESFAIAIAPDLTLPISRQPHPDLRNATTLIAALSESSQGLPSLQFVEQQIQTLETLLPSRVLLNQEFTVAHFQQELATRPYRIVHLATHGEYGSRRQDTFLLASDGRISADDLSEALRQRTSTRPEAIDLLVLGACETAEGDQQAWLGLSGLAIRAGARSTLATLWKVSADEAPGDLFAQFYQTWLQQGQSKAKALQAAQCAFLAAAPNSRSRPHLWAVYVLVGDWR